jgi:MarR family transcriptional regulator, organic hydroperoxide resistance regulator
MDDTRGREDAIRAVLDAQQTLSRTLLGDQMREWIHLDLSMAQLKALMLLTSHDGVNVGALAGLLGVGKPGASILVDRLVQLGYAERAEDAEDRRRTVVTPTERGQALATQLRQAGGSHFERLLAEMDLDDLAALARGLRALADVAERTATRAEPAHE